MRVHTSFVRDYVGVTDTDWYRFLAARPDLSEVNFWRPSGGRGFHSLSVGGSYSSLKERGRVKGGVSWGFAG